MQEICKEYFKIMLRLYTLHRVSEFRIRKIWHRIETEVFIAHSNYACILNSWPTTNQNVPQECNNLGAVCTARKRYSVICVCLAVQNTFTVHV